MSGLREDFLLRFLVTVSINEENIVDTGDSVGEMRQMP